MSDSNYTYLEAAARRKKKNQVVSILIIIAVVLVGVAIWGVREHKKSEAAERIKNALNSQAEPPAFVVDSVRPEQPAEVVPPPELPPEPAKPPVVAETPKAQPVIEPAPAKVTNPKTNVAAEEKLAKAQAAAEAKAKAAEEKKAKLEASRLAAEEKAAAAKAATQAKVQAAAEAKAKVAEEKKAKAEAARMAAEEKAAAAKAANEAKTQASAEAKAKAVEEKKAKAEAARMAAEEKVAAAKAATEAKAQAAADAKAKSDEEKKAKAEAARVAAEEKAAAAKAAELAKAQAAADAKAKVEEEKKAKAEAIRVAAEEKAAAVKAAELAKANPKATPVVTPTTTAQTTVKPGDAPKTVTPPAGTTPGTAPGKPFAPEDSPLPTKPTGLSEEGRMAMTNMPKVTEPPTSGVGSDAFKQGLAAYRQQDYANANRIFGQLVKPTTKRRGDPMRDEYVQGQFMRGVSLMRTDHTSEAVTAFQTVLEFEKYYPMANMNLGICYVDLKQYAKAHRSFEAVVRDQGYIDPAAFDEVMQRTRYFWALAWTRMYKASTDPDKKSYYQHQAVLRWKDYETWFSKNDKYRAENKKADDYLKSLTSL